MNNFVVSPTPITLRTGSGFGVCILSSKKSGVRGILWNIWKVGPHELFDHNLATIIDEF